MEYLYMHTQFQNAISGEADLEQYSRYVTGQQETGLSENLWAMVQEKFSREVVQFAVKSWKAAGRCGRRTAAGPMRDCWGTIGLNFPLWRS
jgi:hypothetical protein